ncbi:hypothetical protein ACFV0O_03870 [Kitasatospora sp. NPDC059577]|uniref:hypothetical protein n=1 Tax=unclassified Kitasatospora TaxID=2633591 RepID=UPI0036CF92B2
MSSTATRRRTALVCAAAALGLVAAGVLAVRVPPPARGPVQAHPAQPPRPVAVAVAVAVVYDPALRPSGTSRSGIRVLLPGAGAPADVARLVDGQALR